MDNSLGGSTVLLYASKHKEVSTIVNVSGRLDLKDGLKERFGENFEEKIEASGFLDVKDPSGDGIYISLCMLELGLVNFTLISRRCM